MAITTEIKCGKGHPHKMCVNDYGAAKVFNTVGYIPPLNTQNYVIIITIICFLF